MSKRELKILLLLACAQFTNIVDFVIMMPLEPQLVRMFGISTIQFSLLVASYSLSAGISAIACSFYVDDFDRKKSFLFIYAGFLMGTFLCASAQSYEVLLAARIFTGFFGGIMGSQIMSIVGDIIQPSHRGRAMGVVMGAYSAASVIGIPLGLFIAANTSWHAPFFSLAGIGAFIFIFGFKTLPPMRSHLKAGSVKRSKTEIYSYVWKKPKLRWALCLFPMLMLTHFPIIPFISPYMSANIGFSDAQLSYIYFCGGAFTIVSAQLVGRWVDKTNPYHVFRILAFAVLIPIFVLTHLPVVPIWQALVVTTIFFVTASSRSIAAMTAVTGSIEPRFRGGFMSMNAALQQLGAGIATFVTGFIVERGSDGKLLHYGDTCYLVVIATIGCLYIFSQFKDVKPQPAVDPLPAEPVV
jgi:predicted MFS family arabinose efflux permease